MLHRLQELGRQPRRPGPESRQVVAPLPRRPLLRPGYRALLDSERLLLEHGQRVVVLEGRAATTLLPALLPLLDGERSVDELVAILGEATRPAVEKALMELAARRLVCEGPSLRGVPAPLCETAEAIAAETESSPAAVASALGAVTFAVVGRSQVATTVAELLEASGVRVRRPRRWRETQNAVVVAAPGRGDAGALARFNRRALRRGTVWLPIVPYDGRIAAVGPLVLPGETACYRCYLLRRAAAVDYGGELLALEQVAIAARPAAPLDALTAQVAALQALRWVGARDPRVPGTMLVVEPGAGPWITQHDVLRVPRCPACAGLDAVAPPLPWHDLPVELPA
jgi:bacteriocin biosynthesis cyclodehydratase domain-containing protein